jgi:hypothetical protein
MKTTVDLPDPLVREAKRLAAREGTTLRALIEKGLRDLIEAGRRRPNFSLRDASVGGNGLSPAFRGAGWDDVRDAAYDGRGG